MIINTKLQPPSLRSRILFRKTLISRLRAAKDYPLILISGPAGSGKTSLFCQTINAEKFRTAWYSLDEEDNNKDLFFKYIFTGLARADQRLNKDFAPFLKRQKRLEDENCIHHLIASLSLITQDLYLVLDDFHHITNEKIHAALARLIQYIPSRLHLVILSRFYLPAPMEVAGLKKELLKFTASDLKFTKRETADLFTEIFPLSFTPRQIEKLNRHVEGWAAGLQLIGLSVSSKGPAVDLSYILSQAHEQISSYLIHDILKMQPEKIRNFIFATALLDRFNPELCTEITGIPDARKVLGHLTRMNLFLIPLDTQHKWYRYHHIFSEVIRQQVRIQDSNVIPETLRKAATWLACNNNLEDALRCAFRSDDLEFTADLMENHIFDFSQRFDASTGIRWIMKMPKEILRQRPLLKLQQCCFHSFLMELSEVRDILSTLEIGGKMDFGMYSKEKRILCQDYAAYLKCILHIFYDGKIPGADQLETLRNKIVHSNSLFARAVETHIVFILISQGELKMAEVILARLAQVALSKSGQLIMKRIYHAKIRALIAQHRGKLGTAEAILIHILQYLDQQGYNDSSIACLFHRQLGSIYYHQNRLQKARECVANIVKYYECEFFGLIDEIMAGNELRLQLLSAAEEYEQVAQCIRQMQAFSVKLGIPRISAGVDACFARIAIDRNNLEVARLWSSRRNLVLDEPFSLLFAMESLTQARLFYAERRYNEGVQLLENLRSRCVKRSLGELVFRIDILYAATLYAINQEQKSVSVLKNALAFAEIEGYLRSFVNNSSLIEPILRSIAAEAPWELPPANLERVFAACGIPLYKACKPRRFDGIEPEELTPREIEILEWMSRGFQNKEIAQKGCIAVTTVKSHVSNILDKLSVKTRTQAVMKAREMKILKPE